MFIYQILIEYDGTNFVGWQKQKNGISIQQSIEKVLKKILKQNISVYGSGRTDSGVHAIQQSAHFQLKKEVVNRNKLLNSINFFLNKKKISILSIKKKKKNFHARFSAKKRIYKYLIINRDAPLSLDYNKAWHIKKNLNINLMKKGALILRENKDFSTFRSSSCGAKSPIRNLDFIKIKKNKDKIILSFQSKSFLQNQVRSMVGCLKYLSEGKWSLDKFKAVIKSKNRKNCAPPAPACGLYLESIIY